MSPLARGALSSSSSSSSSSWSWSGALSRKRRLTPLRRNRSSSAHTSKSQRSPFYLMSELTVSGSGLRWVSLSGPSVETTLLSGTKIKMTLFGPSAPREMFTSCTSWLWCAIQSSLGSKACKDMEILGLIGAESWPAGNVRVGWVGDWIAGRQTDALEAKNGQASADLAYQTNWTTILEKKYWKSSSESQLISFILLTAPKKIYKIVNPARGLVKHLWPKLSFLRIQTSEKDPLVLVAGQKVIRSLDDFFYCNFVRPYVAYKRILSDSVFNT